MDDPGAILATMMAPGLANAFRLFGFSEADEALMHPKLRQYAEAGRNTSIIDYLAAHEKAEQLGAKMRALHTKYDLLVTPTLPLPPIGAEEEAPSDPRYSHIASPFPLASPFNITKQPAASLPVGLNADGLPVGMQVVGPLYGEATILRLCRANTQPCHAQRGKNACQPTAWSGHASSNTPGIDEGAASSQLGTGRPFSFRNSGLNSLD